MGRKRTPTQSNLANSEVNLRPWLRRLLLVRTDCSAVDLKREIDKEYERFRRLALPDVLSEARKKRYPENYLKVRAYHREHPGQSAKWSRMFRERNPDYQKTWHQRNPEKVFKYKLKNLYNLSVDEYNEMQEYQNGLCALCGKSNPSGRNLNVDHDHETGKVRELLCTRCNSALGCFDDDIGRMKEAIKYITKHKEKQVA